MENIPAPEPEQEPVSATAVPENASRGPGSRSDGARASQSPQIVIQQGGGLLMRLLAIFGWAGFALCGLLLLGQMFAFQDYFDTTGGISEKFHSGAKFSGDKVAVIDVSGVIMEERDGFVKRQIDRVREDEKVKALVVRVNSPGGTITGSDYIYHHLNELREERDLPLVVSMGSVAASGGYYVSMAVGDQPQTIYAEPTTTTGSIGVIVPHYDISGLLERFDIQDDSIASHPRKQMMSMTKPMSEEDRKIMEEYVDEAFQRFKEVVRSGRPALRKHEANLDELATGQIFTANQALSSGLVDELGFLEDAIDRAVELAGLREDNYRVIEYKRPLSLLGLAPMLKAHHGRQGQLEALFELSTPRAYYLSTSLPPLVASYSRASND